MNTHFALELFSYYGMPLSTKSEEVSATCGTRRPFKAANRGPAFTLTKCKSTGDGRVLKPHSGRQRVQRTRTGKNRLITTEPGVPKTSTVKQLASDEEVDEFSDARSSVDDLLSPQAMLIYSLIYSCPAVSHTGHRFVLHLSGSR